MSVVLVVSTFIVGVLSNHRKRKKVELSHIFKSQ